MDSEKLKLRLEMAQEQIAAVERHIARQHRTIWDLEQVGDDATEAWCLLVELETSQALHIVDRDQLIKVLAESS
jgi:hypothetical protein